MELSITVYDDKRTHEDAIHRGPLGASEAGGDDFMEKSLMSCRSASIWRAWPCRSKKLLRRGQGQIGQRSKAHAATLQ